MELFNPIGMNYLVRHGTNRGSSGSWSLLVPKRIALALLSVASFLTQFTPVFAGEANFDHGVELYKLGKYKEALPVFDKAILANRISPTPYYYKAVCLQQSGNTIAALTLYKQIRQSFPDSQEAKLASSVLDRSLKPSGTAFANAQAAASAANSPASIAAAVIPQTSANLASFQAANVSDAELAFLPDETKVPFTRGVGGHLFVTVFIDKRPLQVIFDTGASTCFFGMNQLSAAGITPQLTDSKQEVGGVGSHVQVAKAAVVDVRLGDIERHMPIMVVESNPAPPLLGETFFNGYRYDIDNQGGFIHLMKKTGSHSRFAEAMDTIDIPFKQVGNNMVVEGKVNGVPCPMYFDTGAFGVTFSYMSALMCGIRIPQDASRRMNGGVGGSSLAYEFPVDRLELGPIMKTNIKVDVLTQGGPAFPLLGQSFFSDRRYTIDNDKHVIKFVH